MKAEPQPEAVVPAGPEAGPGAVAGPTTGMLGLQRSAGNAAVGRMLQRDPKKPPPDVSVAAVGLTNGKVTIPLSAALKASPKPANATGVVWSVEKGTVDPTGVTIDPATGVITVAAGQEGGEIQVKATAKDGSEAWTSLRLIEKPTGIASTAPSGGDNYGGQFVHTFTAPSGKSSGLEGGNVNEKFASLAATPPWGGAFALSANAAGSHGWDIDSSGAMAGPDNVTIKASGVNAGQYFKSASHPAPKTLPDGFTMKQSLHAKSFPGGALDAAPFATVDHKRTLVAGPQFETSAKESITEDYTGPAIVTNAAASPATIVASPPKPKSGTWAQNTVSVTADVLPTTATMKFSITGKALGCKVDQSGTVTIGASKGTITVRVTGGKGNFDEVKITIEEFKAPAAATPAKPVKTAELDPAPEADTDPEATGAGRGTALLQRQLASAVLARRCACGGLAGPDGECEECRAKREAGILQRVPTGVLARDPQAVGAEGVVAGIRKDDVSAAVVAMRGIDGAGMTALRQTVNGQVSPPLEQWLAKKRSRRELMKTAGKALGVASAVVPGLGVVAAGVGLLSSSKTSATAEEGLRLVWPALGLIERLEIYDEGWRELEQAQLDVIRHATDSQRAAARADAKLEGILGNMDAKEEWEARGLIDPTPEGRYVAAERLLKRAPGVFSDEEDAVFDALMKLGPAKRKDFYSAHSPQLASLLSNTRFVLLGQLCTGSEAQAIIARLRLATEGRRDDMQAVAELVDRATELLRERQALRASLAGTALPGPDRAQAEARMKELNDLDELLNPKGAFMTMLAEARGDAGAFGKDAARLGEFVAASDKRQFAKDAAEKRIVLSGGDVEQIRAALIECHAPAADPAKAPAAAAAPAGHDQAEDEKLRKEVLALPTVTKVLDSMPTSERMRVDNAVKAGPFEEVLGQLAAANEGARWGEFFPLILKIARNGEWLTKFRATASDPFGVYARTSGTQREIMESMLNSTPPRVPIKAVLAFTSDVEALRGALADVGEDTRAQLRHGAMLALNPPTGPPTTDDATALAAYRELEGQVKSSQSTLGIKSDVGYQDVIWTILGSEPTKDELATDTGRFQAAELMYQQQKARLDLRRGLSAEVSETDETMVAAGREFAAQFEPMRKDRKVSALDFFALSALHDRFLHRSEEFTEASNTAGEVAGMVAATVAGVVVVAATGGTATPAVVALAAAAGGSARVITQEMFGADFYDPSARDAMLGAVDGALAVVGGELAERGVQLVGLGGAQLANGAARIGGEVALEASAKLTQKVASGAVQAAIDGAFSGTVSQGFTSMTDPLTWRRGVWRGMVSVGQSALAAGLTGLATGGLIGAAMPVAGAAGKRLFNAIAGQSIEKTLEKAGATSVLEAARNAARGGDMARTNELFGQLESKLSHEEALALRDQLNQELTAALHHPPGRAAPSETEAKILAETAPLDGAAVKPEQLATEADIVRRSDPQPPTMDGYADEVDLGNGHTWRRDVEDRWCRFSGEPICGLKVNGAKKLTPEEIAAVRRAEGKLAGVRDRLSQAIDVRAELPGIIKKLQAREVRQASGLINVGALTEHEQDVLRQIFDKELEEVRLQELVAQVDKNAKEIKALEIDEDLAILELRHSNQSLYERSRKASVSGKARDAVLRRSGGKDEFLKALGQSGNLDVDHVYSLVDIVNEQGFGELDWALQVGILNDPQYLRAVDREMNQLRGARKVSWAEFSPPPEKYPLPAVEEARRLEAEIRALIRARIARGGI